MTPENTMKLYSAFPRLYRGKDKSLQESLMSWGFDCGDGWFDLIWKLSQAIEESARQDGIDPQSESWPEAMQVKAKFGTLRFHVRNSNGQIRNLIDKAAEESGRISESNGQTRLQEPNLV